MTAPSPENNPVHNARALIKTLQERFPAFREYAPLAIGIDKQILNLCPETDRKVLRIALGLHTHSLKYLKSTSKATHRFNLDGTQACELCAEHRTHADETLRERFRKEAERIRAQRETEAQERQRTEKLNQLVERFGKKR